MGEDRCYCFLFLVLEWITFFLASHPAYGWLFVGRTVAGITGASFTTASAYIADISTAENRAKNFGMIGAAFGIGIYYWPGHWRPVKRLRNPRPFLRCSHPQFIKLDLWLFYFTGVTDRSKTAGLLNGKEPMPLVRCRI